MSETQHNSTTSPTRRKPWRPIPFAPDYFIRADGAVLSLKAEEPRILRPFSNQTGVAQVDLDRRPYSVARLIAAVFPDLGQS